MVLLVPPSAIINYKIFSYVHVCVQQDIVKLHWAIMLYTFVLFALHEVMFALRLRTSKINSADACALCEYNVVGSIERRIVLPLFIPSCIRHWIHVCTCTCKCIVECA